ncbi:DUF1211 domain-containing protein [Leptospira fletcheri]|uniref:DUF1211 domain-containing protein n=1 Tax=Leptospira fletcheri TaxID=2484981 RepID=A0A4R9GHN0_9LEPT|nr:TMEM175 family protein [Leptospira fletcheri]TGK12262.1 DUF1211 domain-containing protein [Leptospira fletcheri]
MLWSHNYNRLAGQRIHRTEALADGVFAVAFTLLVLDIKLPATELIRSESDLIAYLVSISHKLLSYGLSFITLGIFWTAHSMQFTFIRKSDRHLSWISVLYLSFVSLLPFSTAFLSEFIQFKTAVVLYWLNLVLLGATIYFHWAYAYRNDLLDTDHPDIQAIDRIIRKRVIYAQIFYGLSTMLCLIDNYLSIAVTFLIQLNYAVAPRFKRKRT